VLSLQESGPPSGPPFRERAALVLPGFQVVADGELAIFSRHPIVDWEVQRLGSGTGRSVLIARIRVHERELTVLNTHFFRGRIDPQSGVLARALADIQRAGEIHRLQTDRLVEIAGSFAGPRALTGDFNLPPRGGLYRRLTAEHVDTFAVAGRGFGYTFPAALPLVRIDYILASPELGARSCRALRVAGSDHRAVLAEVIFR
jgi:endonuclease/exonuclease/phosphatase (EEP) superfamily protein YafD